jgi:hypothetical protein
MNDLDKILASMQIEMRELKTRVSVLTRELNIKNSGNIATSARKIPICGETYYIDSNGDAYFRNLHALSGAGVGGSGTTGYYPIFTDGPNGIIGDGSIYEESGALILSADAIKLRAGADLPIYIAKGDSLAETVIGKINNSWASSDAFYLQANAGPLVLDGGSSDVHIATAGSSRITILNNGNIGILRANPANPLHIGTYNSGTSLRIEGPASGSHQLALSIGGRGSFGVDAPGVSNGRFLIQEDGKVGIGTASPSYALSIVLASGNIVQVLNATHTSMYSASSYAGIDDLIINNTAAAGAGNSSGVMFSSIGANGGAAISSIGSVSVGAGYGSNLVFQTRSSAGPDGERMRITETGRVGIMTASPAVALDVVGAIHSTDDIYTLAATNGTASDNPQGFSSLTTHQMLYKKVGKLVHVWFEYEGTSNAATMSFTLPYAASSAIYYIQGSTSRIKDNNLQLDAAGSWWVDTANWPSKCNLYKTGSSSNDWATSNTKRSAGYICYEAAA